MSQPVEPHMSAYPRTLSCSWLKSFVVSDRASEAIVIALPSHRNWLSKGLSSDTYS